MILTLLAIMALVLFIGVQFLIHFGIYIIMGVGVVTLIILDEMKKESNHDQGGKQSED